MFEISSKRVDFEKDNLLIKRNINLDVDLDCFILISTDNANFGDLILNNILDYIIDKIGKENTYNDFSIALESINSFIKTRKIDSENEVKLDIIIGILNDNNYIFSNIGKSSCYLINNENEVIELTNKKDNKREFNFISSGNIKNNEIIISSTKRLFNYLSKSDLLDGLVLSEDIKIFNKNIKNILLSELLKENVLVSSLKYLSGDTEQKLTKLDIIKEHSMKFLDNRFSKNVIGYMLVLKDKINAGSKVIKNGVFITGIAISVFFLYSILSTVIGMSTQTEDTQAGKENIMKAKTFLRIAAENVANADVFELNIKSAEDLLNKTKESQIFLNDIAKINDDINVLKKQFNKIEVFEESPENIIYEGGFEKPVKIVKNSLKPYIITKKGVLGPILPNTKPKNYTFSSLEETEVFVDATFMGEELYLLTSSSKVVKFTKNGYFSYIDVAGQKIWEKSKKITSFTTSIYLIGEDNQLYKHPIYLSSFKSGEGYLKSEDLSQIGEILSVSIDGGVYILKKDLSIIKFYSNPYRIEKIIINKLPKNYDIEDSKDIVDIKTRPDLNYFYMLLNNKIWVFQPDTTNYKNTKSLTYIGQIEGDEKEIKDFEINHDGEIVILNEKGLYKVTFEISDDKLIVR